MVGASKVGIAPSKCIVFEDSFQGIEAGRRAGCKVIGLSTTNPADAITGKCDYVVPSLNSLINKIPAILMDR